jgi:membrane fusion protein (multidrug efflux system)
MDNAFHRRITVLALLALVWSAATAAQSSKVAPVKLVAVSNQPIHRVVQLSGTVTAERSAQLSVSTGGLVNALFVDAGSVVAAGDTLLSMDSELARLQWESADAAVKQAGHALADAQRRLQEARRLAPQQSIAETEVLSLVAEVSEDEAALQASSAIAGYRKGILDRHTLRAPFAGVISRRMIDLGEWLNPGQAVLGLVAIDRLRLDFRVPEDYRSAMAADAQISFTLADDTTQQHLARVSTLIPVADPTDRTFLLRAVAEQKVPGMIPGNSVRANLVLATGSSGPVVPRDAVLRHSDGRSIVWVVEASEQGLVARERLVQAGQNFDGLVEIREGLIEGERAVVEGNESLRNGQLVTPTEIRDR